MDRDDDDDWPTPRRSTRAVRAVREYLVALDAGQKPPKRVSMTDPAARWIATRRGPALFPALRTAEVNPTRTMIDRVGRAL
ncbi:MAG: hypothetical protein OES38_05220 [Gammaproteobacteria bacterium]|nr:hypothetical protein [Gammaproteobacteria bacterium]